MSLQRPPDILDLRAQPLQRLIVEFTKFTMSTSEDNLDYLIAAARELQQTDADIMSAINHPQQG